MADDDTDEDTQAQETLAGLVDSDDDSDDEPPQQQTVEPDDDSDESDESLRGPGKRALQRAKSERNKAREEAQALRAKVAEYEDANKSESQRLQEAAEAANTRATSAESEARRLQAAMDNAPEGMTLDKIKAVAKRLSGDDEDALASDAEELYALMAPASPEPAPSPSVPRKPKEALRGGGDPEQEPQESAPNKLADLIGRH